MFLIGLGFTPRMTCCNRLLGAIINTNIAPSDGHTNSLQEKFQKIFLKKYETFNISRRVLLKFITNTFIIAGKPYPNVFYSQIVIGCWVL